MSDPTAIPGPLGRIPAPPQVVVDALIVLGLTVALQLHLALGNRPGDPTVDVVAGLLITLCLSARRPAPVAVTGLFVTGAVLGELLGGGLFSEQTPAPPALLAGVVVFYSLGAHADDRRSLIGAALGVAGLWSTVLASGDVDLESFVLSAGLIVTTPWLTGRATRARGLRLATMRRDQEQRERVAVGEERARIARELHDVVAHNVGAMVVQAQGAQRMLDRDPERTRQALATIEETGRAALSEMRSSLGVLRRQASDAPRSPLPGMHGLEALIEQTRQGGLFVEFVTTGQPRELPDGIGLSAYRIVQEALTNTRKHAQAARAQVVVRYGEQTLELEITDDGRVPVATNGSPHGHGLVGMRERAALYGGRLHAEPGDRGGFVVRASLPLS